MAYEQLKEDIKTVIRTNGVKAITGANTQDVLLKVIAAFDNGNYQFGGVTIPGDGAPAPFNGGDIPVGFIAGEPGTYSDCLDGDGNVIVVEPGEIAILLFVPEENSWERRSIQIPSTQIPSIELQVKRQNKDYLGRSSMFTNETVSILADTLAVKLDCTPEEAQALSNDGWKIAIMRKVRRVKHKRVKSKWTVCDGGGEKIQLASQRYPSTMQFAVAAMSNTTPFWCPPTCEMKLMGIPTSVWLETLPITMETVMRRFTYVAEKVSGSATNKVVQIISPSNYNRSYNNTRGTVTTVHVAGARKYHTFWGIYDGSTLAKGNLISRYNQQAYVSIPLSLALVKFDEDTKQYKIGPRTEFYGIMRYGSRRVGSNSIATIIYNAKIGKNAVPKTALKTYA